MKIQFLGATGTVTGSKYRVSADGKSYLIDCGLFQGLKTLRLRNREPLPFDPASLHAILLTHAHIDHSGYLPLVAKQGFKGPVYVTHGTSALCRILLPDCGYLQEEEAAYANKHGFSKHHPALPLYTRDDAVKSLDLLKSISWKKEVALDKTMTATFFRAGHILGSSFVRLQHEDISLTFSGDLGRPHSPMMRPPEDLPETDFLVLESTYGDRIHPREDPRQALKTVIEKTVRRGGIVLIPAFAVGRTQDLLKLISDLKKSGELSDVPVFLNSPMAIQSTRIYREHIEDLQLTREECAEHCTVAHYISTPEESRALAERRDPAVIISASGMATGGRVLHHLKSLAPDARNTILLAGFQAVGTRGESLLHGADKIKIHGAMVPVNAEIAHLDTLSAHADADEIMAWIGKLKHPPRMTFITHGEPLASEALRKRIQNDLGWPCTVPDHGQSVDLR